MARVSVLRLIAALLCLSIGAPALAITAEEYFDDGNRLFRDNLYWAALLRYRQASDAGLNTPLLHYNMGVAHYKAGQNIRAREELQLALESPTLRTGAQYSLGLNAYALGETDEALRWFRLARDQNRNDKLASYARIAISRIHAEEDEASPIVAKVEEERRKREFTHFLFRSRISFGSDSNVFRTPGQDYIDFGDPNLPVVTPEVRSGVFMPISLSAKYHVNAYTHEGFFGAYRLAGRYYQDKELQNGNEYSHELSFGSEYQHRDEESGRSREVYSAFKVAQHDEVYYDPDDGGIRQINGIDIGDRMNYLRYGPELNFRQAYERLAVGMIVRGELWNYTAVEQVPEYDHEYMLLGLNAQYRFGPTSLLRIEVDGYTRRYGDRPSFELDGTQIVGAPPVRYDYLDISLTARQRVFNSLWFGVEYQRTDRRDQHVGYNDYVRNSYGAEIHWRPHLRFSIELGGFYRLYDYPNAFAFHTPVAGRKTLETADARLIATYRMTPSLSLVFEGRMREKASNDFRIAYDRNQFVLGIRWQH
jgi:tetratricopeptide (TPR) repeat protein